MNGIKMSLSHSRSDVDNGVDQQNIGNYRHGIGQFPWIPKHGERPPIEKSTRPSERVA